MVDYSKIIMELIEESESCNYRYGGMVPLYYQQQINEAVAILIGCQKSQTEKKETCWLSLRLLP